MVRADEVWEKWEGNSYRITLGGMKCSKIRDCDDWIIPYKYPIAPGLHLKMDEFQSWGLTQWCCLPCVPKALD